MLTRSAETKGWPMRAHLAVLAALLVIPAIVFAVYLIDRARQQLATQAEMRLVQLSVDLADDISVQLERATTIVQSLMLSAALAERNYAELHSHARKLLGPTGDNFLLYDGAGRPLINSAVPWGTKLTNRAQGVPLELLERSGQPYVSNLIWGRTRKAWVINVMVPEVRDGVLRHLLVYSLSSDRIREVLKGQATGSDWTSGVSDRNHVLIARTRLHEEFVGKSLTPELIEASRIAGKAHRIASVDGRRIVRAVSHTRVGGWTVAAAVSEDALFASIDAATRELVAAGIGLLLLSIFFVAVQGERLASAIRTLGRPEASFKLVTPLPVREANEAAAMLAKAADELRATTAGLQQRDEVLRLALSAAYAVAFTWDIRKDVVQRPFSSEPGLAATVDRPDTLEGVISAVHPEDREKFRECLMQALEHPEQPYRNEYRLLRPDGEVRWLEDRGRVECAGDGVPIQMVGIVFDVTERKLAAQALVESERRFRELADSMPQLVWTANEQGHVTYFNRRREEYLLGDRRSGDWQSFIFPDDLERTRQRWHGAVANATDYECEHRVRRADGSFRWQLSRARPVRHGDGIVWYGTATDIHDLREREERIRLLMREVNHRAKNLLAVVLSVARQTSRSGDANDFVERLTDRVQGLAASQDLLVRSEWRGVDLEELVRAQLSHYRDLIGQRIVISGEPLRVDANAAQVIGMALHELATNAAKYGALSMQQGRVEIMWHMKIETQTAEFALTWCERDGPPAVPPERTGFGHTVLVQMAEHALGASVHLEYGKQGFSWSLVAPIERVVEVAGAGDGA